MKAIRELTAMAIVLVSVASEELTDRSPRVKLTDLANDIISKSSSSSQVVSLNLSNLGILLLLKTLIFGAFYLGGDKHHHKSRALEHEDIISEQDLLFILAFIVGNTEHNNSCLQRIACQDPSKSKEYLMAAKYLAKGTKLFNSFIPFDDKYEKIILDLQDAINFGTKYGTCAEQYSCHNKTDGISNGL